MDFRSWFNWSEGLSGFFATADQAANEDTGFPLDISSLEIAGFYKQYISTIHYTLSRLINVG